MRRLFTMLAVSALMVAFAGATGRAQCSGRTCARRTAAMAPTPAIRYVQPVAYTVPAPAVPMAVDPLAHVNFERSRRGLRRLAWDASLASAAATNNAMQAGWGLGHHYTGGSAQCSASTADPGYAAWLWATSRDHAALLFDPSARVAGVSYSYGYATLNIRR